MAHYMDHWGEAYSHAANNGVSPHRAAQFADEYATLREKSPITFSVEWHFKLYFMESSRVYHETADGRIARAA